MICDIHLIAPHRTLTPYIHSYARSGHIHSYTFTVNATTLLFGCIHFAVIVARLSLFSPLALAFYVQCSVFTLFVLESKKVIYI